MLVPTLGELTKTLRYWMKILHLEDYKLTVTLVPQSKFEAGTGHAAEITVNHWSQTLDVKFATDPPEEDEKDWEAMCVHELLHAVTRPVNDVRLNHRGFLSPNLQSLFDGEMNDAEHEIVCRMTRVLVEMDRSKRKEVLAHKEEVAK